MPIVLVIAYKKLFETTLQWSVGVGAYKVRKILLSRAAWRRMRTGGTGLCKDARPSYIAARNCELGSMSSSGTIGRSARCGDSLTLASSCHLRSRKQRNRNQLNDMLFAVIGVLEVYGMTG